MKNTTFPNIKPYPLGVHAEGDTIRFSFVSRKKDCGVLIYDRKTGKRMHKLAFTEQERIGNMHCKYISDLAPEQIAYQFYEEDEIVPDPYARGFAVKMPYGRERRTQDLKAVLPADQFDWERDSCPRIPYADCLCYCAHVRGFTRHSSSGVVHRGTFAGMQEKLDYLKKTGITTVELQPVYEFTEIPTKEERKRMLGAANPAYAASESDLDMLAPKKCNYWGYKQGYYYAPKAAYAAGEDAGTEFKELVRAFHRNGMEIILQFYFPETVRKTDIMDILRYWILEYHVDGFHLMGNELPMDMIAAEEMFADTKLWYYSFNTDRLYAPEEVPAFRNLAFYNDEYLYAMRKYLKGDDGMLDTVITQMRKIPLKAGRIHYMSNYFGFTLMDMVCYEWKHNEDNGEDNRDGNDYNCSWNCGEEGPSRRKKVQNLRKKQIKNAIALLMLTQSTPLIFMGDEFGNSQKGNNNPYCQDNAITWLNWNDLQRHADIYAFWLEMVQLRKNHPVLHPERECRIMDYLSCGYPDLSYHGESAWRLRTDSYNRHVGIMFCGKYATNKKTEDAFIYLALNMYWEPRSLAMPKLPQGMHWQLIKCTEEISVSAAEAEKQEDEVQEAYIQVPGRSFAVYMGIADQKESGKRKKSSRKE